MMQRSWILFFSSLLFLFAPLITQAETCSCFCKSSSGAYQQGQMQSIADCQQTCDDFLGCYTEDQQDLAPQFNTLCWTEYECEHSVVEMSGQSIESEWAGQEPFCLPGEGYCYSDPEPITLNVAIGSLTEATSFGEYVNASYSFLLTASSLLAIVMLMLGGMQYMLARGKQESVGKAKTRIRNAVVGVVLLFSTYVIANLVSPEFTTFNRLDPPRIRTVVFLDPESTCEAMQEAGLVIEPTISGQEECGDTGIVADIGDVQSTVTQGMECTYSACDDDMQACMSSTESESGYACIRCAAAGPAGLSPSASVCSNLLYSDPEPTDDQKYYCEYDPGYFDIGLFSTACVELVYPQGEDYFDCDALRAHGQEEGMVGCRVYDEVLVGYASEEWIGEDIEMDYNEVDDIEGDDEEFPWLRFVCESDPCGFAPPGETCEAFISDPDELMYIIPASYLLLDELIVNCSNSSSDYGLLNCLQYDGSEGDCNQLDF